MIVRILNIALLMVVLVVCSFLFIGYSALLDFFPWGSNKSYVIWEPLVIYYIIPGFICVGVLNLFIHKSGDRLSCLIYLIIGLFTTIPVLAGFDLEEDDSGRWLGVLSSVLSIILIINVLSKVVTSIRNKKQ